MPDIPDFDQITARVVTRAAEGQTPLHQAIRDALRDVWNARGAADIATLEADLSSMMGPTAAGPYCKNLDRALRALDR